MQAQAQRTLSPERGKSWVRAVEEGGGLGLLRAQMPMHVGMA